MTSRYARIEVGEESMMGHKVQSVRRVLECRGDIKIYWQSDGVTRHKADIIGHASCDTIRVSARNRDVLKINK